jgi:hypothetical protein
MYDLLILHGHPWGGRFQVAVIEERQVIGGKGRIFQTEKSRYGLKWKVFGSVTSF